MLIKKMADSGSGGPLGNYPGNTDDQNKDSGSNMALIGGVGAGVCCLIIIGVVAMKSQ